MLQSAAASDADRTCYTAGVQLLYGNAHRGAADAGRDRQYRYALVGAGNAAVFPVTGKLSDILQMYGDPVDSAGVSGQQGIAYIQ